MKRVNAIAFGLLVAATSFSATSLADEEGEGDRPLPLVSNTKWNAECSSCHTLYHPSFLPARSWRKLMGGLDKHFGQNASLDPVTQQEITNFLVKYSADQGGAKYAKSIPASSTPLRITDTAWFKRTHGEIRVLVWKRTKIGSPSNCMACHQGAEKGDFSEVKVAIPR